MLRKSVKNLITSQVFRSTAKHDIYGLAVFVADCDTEDLKRNMRSAKHDIYGLAKL